MATKSDDCYFYYYSNCTKGDACPYRHCAEALGNETTCALWRDGRCCRAETCRFRHMEITKDRSQIYCYWETQPGGCRKPHCAFKHRNKDGADALTTSDPIKKSTPDPALVMKTIPKLDAQDVSTPSPKIEPIVFNPFEEDSDRESVGIVSPKKAVKKPVSLPPAKTGKIKLTKPAPNEDEGLGFEIKSLDELKSEKIAKAKQILHEADKLVASQSVPEADTEDTTETNPKISSPHRVSAIERLGEAVTSKPAVCTDPNPVVRRVVTSNVDDEDSNDSEAVAEAPKQERIAVLKEDSGKADSKPVSRRVNVNKGRRIIIADNEVKTVEKLTTTTRKVSPKSGVLSRISSQAEPAPAKKHNIKARLGNQEATKTHDVLSRLGLVGQREESASPTDTTSIDDLPGADPLSIRRLELERAKLAATLKQLEEQDSDSTGDEEEAPPAEEIGIKSLEDIQREKALESMKQNRLKKSQSQPKPKQSPESRPTGVKKRVLTTRKSGKQEQQIYKPPAAKLKEAETSSSLKERLGRRSEADGSEVKCKAAPEQRVSPNNRTRQGENSENVPQKKSGWGVKTYSEIMREKQQRLAGKQDTNRDKSNERANRPSKKFTPIVFDDDEKPKIEKKVTTTKRKFVPVVFDLDDKETDAEDSSKKFKPVTAPQSVPQPVIRRSLSEEESEKTTPSPRRQLSRQQSNKSVAQDAVTSSTTTTTARKLKRRSSSQILNPDVDSTTTKVRRRSSSASRKSIDSEKSLANSREDSLDLLDDEEFGDLLGDVDIENTSALHVKNDDDLLQEMEELLA